MVMVSLTTSTTGFTEISFSTIILVAEVPTVPVNLFSSRSRRIKRSLASMLSLVVFSSARFVSSSRLAFSSPIYLARVVSSSSTVPSRIILLSLSTSSGRAS